MFLTFCQKLIFWVSILFFTLPAQATVTLIEDLSFGTIVVSDNSVVSDIIISRAGQTSIVNHIRVIEPGHPAEFALTDLPGNLEVFTSAVITQATTSNPPPAPATEQFTISSPDIVASVTTNGSGFALVRVGATLSTSGNGGNYVDVQYQGTLQVTFNY
ncbi:DUF4402 domain-containing protein [Thalassomonas actiniarum]|uniref:DUF4402 domain-containing protein n=1 Tax=Thalassomonas actiniarum TaxID=485447 RepID=A0AAE9YS28_9GAMM|nr:DUF4402 domain-containing protein [Thalassomonas actiniarum]WDD99258.1 DUF4402 domain-containing protein [Thalassomonas actiniarum]